MKVISDSSVIEFLNSNLNKDTLLNKFIPTLARSLTDYAGNPNQIVPPRTVQASNNSASDTTHIYMPCISPNEVGIKVISGGELNNSKGLGFQGCVLVMDVMTGQLQAVMNANTLTAFRTALASFLGVVKVIDKQDILPEITVFGTGAQAYWHVKLALILYPQLQQVNILNRTLKNAKTLAEKLSKEFKGVTFNAFSYHEDEKKFKSHILNSSLIFGCIPSTTPVIEKDYLNANPKYPKFISLIGSYKPHMIELDLNVINDIKSNNVSILVDSKEHTLLEAGELIQSNCNEQNLLEIQELYNSKSLSKICDPKTNITLQKIVGLSIMDLSIGSLIYNEIGRGAVNVEDF